jgi:hypothetical protein
MITLTTSFTIPNGTRLEISKPVFDDDASVCVYSVRLLTPLATNAAVTTWQQMVITNTSSDKIERQMNPPVGLVIEDPRRYFVQSSRATGTGYTDAVNAWRGQTTANARKTAWEAHLLSAGHIDASLTGT